jgi:hypothetical protein
MTKHFFDLPEFIISLTIFSYLEIYDYCKLDIACTSRQLRQQLYYLFSCTKWNQQEFITDITSAKMFWLYSRSFPLTQLSLASDLTHDDICETFELIPLCPRVVSLNFNSNLSITDSLLADAGKFLSGITQIDASYCHNLTDSGIQQLAHSSSDLSRLNLSCCRNVTKNVLALLAVKCGRLLSHLNISYLQGIDEMSIKFFAQRCSNLSHLNLSRCTEVTDSTLLIVSEACPNLTDLDISNCRKVKDFSIIELSKRCSLIQNLNFRHCKSLSDKALSAVAEGCPRLQTLTVSYCVKLTDMALVAISKGCRKLRRVNMSYCGFITDGAIQALAQHCPELEHLNISFCSYILHPETVNFRGKVDISYKKFSQLAHWHNNFLLHTSS